MSDDAFIADAMMWAESHPFVAPARRSIGSVGRGTGYFGGRMRRLPWVSRGEHERALHDVAYWKREADIARDTGRETTKVLSDRIAELVESHERDAGRAERDMVRSETRYADLMASYKALRLQGHAEPVVVPKPEPLKVDPVIQAVNAAAKDDKTRSQMLRQVAIDRKAELSDEEIIMRIQRGNRPAEEVQ